MAIETTCGTRCARRRGHPAGLYPAVWTVTVTLALTGLALAACGGPGEPVARLEVETSSVRLAYPGTAEVNVTWTPAVALEKPIVFVHLWDRQGRLLRTFDHPYPGPWQVGEERSYGIELWQSALGPPLPPGSYELAIGVTAQGDRPPLAVDGAEIDSGEYLVGRVEVPAPGGVGPRLRLAEGWELPGAESDRQILGGRWLHKAGRMTVGGLTGPLDVALRLRIPSADQMPHILVLDEGVTTPGLRISSACSPVTRKITGFGSHQVIVPLVPGTANAGEGDVGEGGAGEGDSGSNGEAAGVDSARDQATDCTIDISADFAYLDPATLQRLSANLMRVEWSPGATAPAGTADGR